MTRLSLLGAASALLLAGCLDGGPTSLRFDPSPLNVAEGQVVNLKVLAVSDDGSTEDVTGKASLSIVGDAASLDGAALAGAKRGTAELSATFEDLSGSATVTVGPVVPATLEMVAEGELKVGEDVKLRVFGTPEGSETRFEITDVATITSSDTDIAEIGEGGAVTIKMGGAVTFTAEFGGKSVTLESSATCDYIRRYSGQISVGGALPPITWPARREDGEEFTLRMQDVYCNKEWKETKTLIFSVSAGWCGPCTAFAQRLQDRVAELRRSGSQPIIVEAQDYQGAPADVEFAYEHLDSITDDVPAIAVGDSDSDPELFFAGQNVIQAFPTIFVVRTRDMKVIALSSGDSLPLEAIAADPEADWASGGFVNRCGASPDEASEPNDQPDQAQELSSATELSGGICTNAPDLYQVNIEGDWTFTIDFQHAVGDLDVFVWDERSNQPLYVDGQTVGSQGTGNREQFSYSGPALVGVLGYRGASAPYELSLTSP